MYGQCPTHKHRHISSHRFDSPKNNWGRETTTENMSALTLAISIYATKNSAKFVAKRIFTTNLECYSCIVNQNIQATIFLSKEFFEFLDAVRRYNV